MTHQQGAIDAIREWEIVMGDPWRNDYAEDGEKADCDRFEKLVEQVMAYMEFDTFEKAEEYIERHRHRTTY